MSVLDPAATAIRLFDSKRNLHFFPIRHHSPACAVHLCEALRAQCATLDVRGRLLGDGLAVAKAQQLVEMGMHAGFSPGASSSSRSCAWARASCDLDRLAVPPSIPPIWGCV